jgi:hypothetical protein
MMSWSWRLHDSFFSFSIPVWMNFFGSFWGGFFWILLEEKGKEKSKGRR